MNKDKLNEVASDFMKKIKIKFDLDGVLIITNRGSAQGVHSVDTNMSSVMLTLCKAQLTMALAKIETEEEKEGK